MANKELRSIEGTVISVERSPIDFVLWVLDRLGGDMVECCTYDKDYDCLYSGDRVVVTGVKMPLNDKIIIDSIKKFPPDDDLPDFDSIVDPGFTNGMESVEYLKKLRGEDK